MRLPHGNHLSFFFILFLFVNQGSAGSSASGQPEESTAQNLLSASTMRQITLPWSFEPNLGQAKEEVQFLSHRGNRTLFLTSSEVVLVTANRPTPAPDQWPQRTRAHSLNYDVVSMRFAGANSRARLSGLAQLPGKSNYFIGNDPGKWRTGIPTYARVKYQGLYPGIDLVFYATDHELEYDLVVAPGADPAQIALELGPAAGIAMDANGSLVLSTANGVLLQRRPKIYQIAHGKRLNVSGNFLIRNDRTIGFEIAPYDTSKPLVIDPELVYSTYLGGSAGDFAVGVAADAQGNAYITGFTASADFPVTAKAVQKNDAGSGDAFVTKLSKDGKFLIYSTFLGGSATDQGSAIAVNKFGEAYVAGATASIDFPATHGVVQTGKSGGSFDAFVTRISANGQSLVYSTYLGGSDLDAANSIALDKRGRAFVAGDTFSGDFPTTPGSFRPNFGGGGIKIFVTKLNEDATALLYSTFLGGNFDDFGGHLTVDSHGHAYVTGVTQSPSGFPITPGAFQSVRLGNELAAHAFVTKFSKDGGSVIYSTYLESDGRDLGNGIAVDGAGNAYVTGETGSFVNHPFPTTPGAFQTTFGGGDLDVFVTKLNRFGTALEYSTLLGGNSEDVGNAISVDPSGHAFITGSTQSSNFPSTANALQKTLGGGMDAFVVRLSKHGTRALFSSFLGGSGDDAGFAIDVDPQSNAYVAGITSSSNFPTTRKVFQRRLAGESDGFVTKIGVRPSDNNSDDNHDDDHH
ncbi:MAG: SBBP repeat-containing protein [Acidobacteriia bacterium]|nr:SBBP repeat-containing protein [Terriglobia bacterium]